MTGTATTTGRRQGTATIDRTAAARLRGRFRGALLAPGTEGYEEARRVWNGAVDRRPALIARCAGADDVVQAVRFAREQDLPVSVRGGGHAVAGHAVCDAGLMIDLSLMKAVRVDPGAGTARVAGGALLGDLVRATQRFGLAAPAGVVSHTGVGGLTLGGGLGHLMRRFGLTVDNLLGVDLITADGQALHVDQASEPELFWGLRGGGGNFGIATAFEYRLHPVGPVVLGGPIFWPVADAPEVLGFLRDFAPQAPDELGIVLTARLAPPGPLLPPEQHGRPVVGLLLVWTGDPAAGQRAIAPLRRLGRPVADLVRPTPFLSLQSILDAGNPHGMGWYWRSQRVRDLSDDVIGVLADRVDAITSPLSYIAGFAMGGAAARVDPGATAVGARPLGYELSIVAGWPPGGPDGGRHRAWVQRGWEALAAHRTGVFSHFLSDEGAAGLKDAYGGRLRRLTALKDRYDPDNLFRMNANIPPGNGRGRTGGSDLR
jgi:FAD/FMN-containing dehydrogenase